MRHKRIVSVAPSPFTRPAEVPTTTAYAYVGFITGVLLAGVALTAWLTVPEVLTEAWQHLAYVTFEQVGVTLPGYPTNL